MRILIAEDDSISRTILHRAVEKVGHECIAAADGEDAWNLYKQNPDLDVVISDWMMPGIDGLELCRLVRGDGRDAYTYFIFLTALGDKEHLLMGLEAGADDYLSKPLDRDELQVRLISAARVTALHRRLAQQSNELEKMNRRLFEQSREDPLTGLGNRLRLREDLEVLQARAERYGHSYSLVLCDVDFFKAYNDRYGHLAGDEVLVSVAKVIADQHRIGDTAYRYGGEEFHIVLPEQPLEAAIATADRLRRSIEALRIPHEPNEPSGLVTISAGVATLMTGDAKSPDDLLRETDAALYRAKEAGRNRVDSFSGSTEDTPESAGGRRGII
ncbi:MAG: diguanylate cyclase [Actinomycetota bacterium]|nr:diguanylate cyclase [Actinomycetota bacterium]